MLDGLADAAGGRAPARDAPRADRARRRRRERLRLALEAACDVDERYLALLDELGDRRRNAIFHEEGDGPVLTRAPFTDALRRILEDGAREGTLDPGPDPDADRDAAVQRGGCTYRHMRAGHRWPPEQARGAVVDLLVRGVRP